MLRIVDMENIELLATYKSLNVDVKNVRNVRHYVR